MEATINKYYVISDGSKLILDLSLVTTATTIETLKTVSVFDNVEDYTYFIETLEGGPDNV